ncbi:unnamed protein product [Prunus armeniaca]|uniref:Uncharacterized protein n=1 Tax=Prunus armeniaca TaxID=36596 RepID=A0A6J5XNL6_PRUAR|nr:unnamed protein product [Prunus armeniaca]
MFSPLPLLLCRLLLGWLWLVAVASGRHWWSWWVVVVVGDGGCGCCLVGRWLWAIGCGC